MALSDNIEIITRFELAFRAGEQAAIDELCDPGLIDHNPAPDHEPTLAGLKQKVAGFKAIFPDIGEDLQDIIASGDTVATRWVVTGSQQQELMGIPASGQTIRVEGMNFYRLKDGRVTDIWTQFDGVAMMQQLGNHPGLTPLSHTRSPSSASHLPFKGEQQWLRSSLVTTRQFWFRGKIETAFVNFIVMSSVAKSRKRIPKGLCSSGRGFLYRVSLWGCH